MFKAIVTKPQQVDISDGEEPGDLAADTGLNDAVARLVPYLPYRARND